MDIATCAEKQNEKSENGVQNQKVLVQRAPSLNRHFYPENLDEGDMYIENCQKLHVSVDPSVVITLKTQWNVLKPTKAFCEGSILPLMEILCQNKFITKLNLEGAGMLSNKIAGPGNGNSNARILGLILRENKTIKDLNLCNTGLDDNGVVEICEGLMENETVTKLNISRNSFGEKGVSMLQQVVSKKKNLKNLDISINALGYPLIRSLLSCPCCHLKKKDINIEGNYVFEEILNSLSHAVGILLACVGTVVLLGETYNKGSIRHNWACAIYSYSLIFLYVSSTLYHSLFMIPAANRILKMMDHCAIYFLIAGTYTPFMMIALPNDVSGTVLLIMEWVLCFLGCVFTICVTPNSRLAKVIEMAVYLIMGLMIFCVWEKVGSVLSRPPLDLLCAGGVTYITGIPFYILDKKIPIFHSVWHLFVLSASILHWFSIYKYVIRIDG